MDQPLVSVICLSYNHANYIQDCINSVLHQTYEPIEIIIVDDASTDGSKSIIKDIISKNPAIRFVDIEVNVGNCKAFNKGLAVAQGDYIVDLATDDILLPDRISKQIALFQTLPKDYGVVHTNSLFFDDNDEILRDHTGYLQSKGLLNKMPEGDVYSEIISKFFVSSPTMLVKMKVFKDLGGYDEELDYEDFDFWVRSARKWKYAYLDETLTKIRKVAGSKSTGWYAHGDMQLHSTYLICQKIKRMNRTADEDKSLVKRLKFELRQSLLSNNHREFDNFYNMLLEFKANGLIEQVMYMINKTGLPLKPLRNIYHSLRFPKS